MTKKQMRIAIAEACGYEVLPAKEWFEKPCVRIKGKTDWQVCPDWPEDLNACREAEHSLITNRHDKEEFAHFLAMETTPTLNNEHRSTLDWHLVFDFVNATALQHSVALVKWLGKWVEEPTGEEKE